MPLHLITNKIVGKMPHFRSTIPRDSRMSTGVKALGLVWTGIPESWHIVNDVLKILYIYREVEYGTFTCHLDNILTLNHIYENPLVLLNENGTFYQQFC